MRRYRRRGGVAALLVLGGVAPSGAAVAHPARAERPVVTRVGPDHGSIHGGTSVTIKGRHMHNVKRVIFGGKVIHRVYPLGLAKVQVASPAHAAGTVHIRVV